jgi:TonB family protein
LITQPVAAQQQPDVAGDAGRATPPDSAAFDRLPEAYTSATPGSLSPWVWSLPAIAVLIAAGFLASRFLNRSAPPPPDSAVAAVSSAERPMPASAEPTVAAPGAEPSTRGRDELGAEDVDGGSSAARTAAAPERDAPAAAARSGSPISLTESFPILRTAKRDEAYDVLRRAQAAGFRAAISRNPRDPLPYTVEAGPHRTAEEAQLEARRARAALGLDQPAGRSRERPPASSETTERADPPPTTSASTAARPSREETATTPRPEQPQPGAQRTPATQEATAAPERAEQQAPREAGERGGASDQPIPVSGDVVAPRLIDGPPPLYTLMARRARLQGVVVMRAVIDEQGAVVDATVLKGLPMGLNESALNAVKGWRYQPATLGGAPVKVTYNIAVNFRLQ